MLITTSSFILLSYVRNPLQNSKTKHQNAILIVKRPEHVPREFRKEACITFDIYTSMGGWPNVVATLFTIQETPSSLQQQL